MSIQSQEELQLHLLTFTVTITITITILMQSLAEQWDQEAVDRLEVVRAEMEAKYFQVITNRITVKVEIFAVHFRVFRANSAIANSKTRENICNILYAHFGHVGVVY